MKQILISAIFAISLLFVACKDKTPENKTTSTKTTNKIEVIDFYGTHRCISCKTIEASAKYTVDTYFANNPKVVFKTVNVDDDTNYNIAENFEAIGTALFLNVIKNGKETHIDLTEFGFSKAHDQEEFSKELKIKIDNELKKL